MIDTKKLWTGFEISLSQEDKDALVELRIGPMVIGKHKCHRKSIADIVIEEDFLNDFFEVISQIQDEIKKEGIESIANSESNTWVFGVTI